MSQVFTGFTREQDGIFTAMLTSTPDNRTYRINPLGRVEDFTRQPIAQQLADRHAANATRYGSIDTLPNAERVDR
jgi:hypothetical protein